jgi:large conductance mechanosensitive channel
VARYRELTVLQEFKDFINKGGIFEAAVGLVMALAFVPVVASMVDDIIMPIVAAIFGQPDFQTLTIEIGDAVISYGNFLTVLISFVVIGFVLFMLVKAYNQMTADDEDSGPSDSDLLAEIRDALTNR